MQFWNLAADLLVSGLGILIVCVLAIAVVRRVSFLAKKNALKKERIERERVLQVELAMQAEWKRKLKNRDIKLKEAESKDWGKLSSN